VPVLLSDLQANAGNGEVQLSWWADGSAFQVFIVERSGQSGFERVASLPAGAEDHYRWEDRGVATGTYAYRIAGIQRNGGPLFLGPVSVEVGAPPRRFILEIAGIAQAGTPARLSLGLPEGGDIRLQVLDLQGRLLSGLDLGVHPPGWHTVPWSPRSATGQELSSGVYYLRATLGGQIATGHVVVLE